MTEHDKTQEQIWDEVGQQFDAMGKSLSDAVDATTGDEQTQQELKRIQADFTSTTSQIVQKVRAAKDSGESPDLDAEADKLSELSSELGERAKAAGQDTARQVQPHLSGALSSVQEGVGQIIGKLKKSE